MNVKHVFQNYLYLLATDKKKGKAALIMKGGLFLFSLLYGVGVKVTFFCYTRRIMRRHQLPCSVISVGNITLGGTGKTPLVEMLAKRLTARGRRVAILSRGYGRKSKRSIFMGASNQTVKTKFLSPHAHNLQPEMIGDEPCLLHKNLPHIPVIVNKDRVESGRMAIDTCGVDTILIDDGFQYWSLARDLDILTIDSTNPFGNHRLIPRGILREPLSALRRAGIFVLTKCSLDFVGEKQVSNIKKKLVSIRPDALIVESIHKPLYLSPMLPESLASGQADSISSPASAWSKQLPITEIKERRVCLLSSIADPEYFERLVKGLGAAVVLQFRFPDHYRYGTGDIDEVVNSCIAHEVKTVVTTEKDGVKLTNYKLQIIHHKLQILTLHIELNIIEGEKEFFDRLFALYSC